MQRNFIIATSRPWLLSMPERLKERTGFSFFAAHNPDELLSLDLETINPEYIFVPHWSWIIPSSIWNAYETVIFHMTDLPFGRGGSPLQNLLLRGHAETKISAIQCLNELDSGPIYLKHSLSLYGSAEEVFLRCAAAIEDMIIEIIQKKPAPLPQKGNPTYFVRRTPEQSKIDEIFTLEKLFDHIRMLDAEGYPPAFIENGKFKLEFRRAALRHGKIEADVTISLRKDKS